MSEKDKNKGKELNGGIGVVSAPHVGTALNSSAALIALVHQLSERNNVLNTECDRLVKEKNRLEEELKGHSGVEYVRKARAVHRTDTAMSLRKRGDECYNNGEHQKARDFYVQALRLNPDDREVKAALELLVKHTGTPHFIFRLPESLRRAFGAARAMSTERHYVRNQASSYLAYSAMSHMVMSAFFSVGALVFASYIAGTQLSTLLEYKPKVVSTQQSATESQENLSRAGSSNGTTEEQVTEPQYYEVVSEDVYKLKPTAANKRLEEIVQAKHIAIQRKGARCYRNATLVSVPTHEPVYFYDDTNLYGKGARVVVSGEDIVYFGASSNNKAECKYKPVDMTKLLERAKQKYKVTSIIAVGEYEVAPVRKGGITLTELFPDNNSLVINYGFIRQDRENLEIYPSGYEENNVEGVCTMVVYKRNIDGVDVFSYDDNFSSTTSHYRAAVLDKKVIIFTGNQGQRDMKCRAYVDTEFTPKKVSYHDR